MDTGTHGYFVDENGTFQYRHEDDGPTMDRELHEDGTVTFRCRVCPEIIGPIRPPGPPGRVKE